jgi:hypothetical protein
MNPLKVLWIDDEPIELVDVINLIEGTTLVNITVEKDYNGMGRIEQDVQSKIAQYDLLVLDVLMEKNNYRPFVDFVTFIGWTKPFLAYTKLPQSFDVEVNGNFVELGQYVLGKGGLGLIEKSFCQTRGREAPSQRDVEYALAERILWFYWARHGSRP